MDWSQLMFTANQSGSLARMEYFEIAFIASIPIFTKCMQSLPTMFRARSNPLFPALRSGPTTGSGASPKSKVLADGE